MATEITYNLGDLDRMRRVLLEGKKPLVEGIGVFRYHNDTVMYEADQALKNLIWKYHYYDRKEVGLISKIETDLLNLKTVVFKGFGKLYIIMRPSYYKWDDFHGRTWVHPKPLLRFMPDSDFVESLLNESTPLS